MISQHLYFSPKALQKLYNDSQDRTTATIEAVQHVSTAKDISYVP